MKERLKKEKRKINERKNVKERLMRGRNFTKEERLMKEGKKDKRSNEGKRLK